MATDAPLPAWPAGVVATPPMPATESPLGRYQYCGGDPVEAADPRGTATEEDNTLWCGYVQDDDRVRRAYGAFTAKTTQSGDYYNNTWIGLGGLRGNMLVQGGLRMDRLRLWWEWIKNLNININPQPIPRDVIKVSKWDTIFVDVRNVGRRTKVYLRDSSNGGDFSVWVQKVPGRSADWAFERNSGFKLGSFGTLRFWSCGWRDSNNKPHTMLGRNLTKHVLRPEGLEPSEIRKDSKGFTIRRPAY